MEDEGAGAGVPHGAAACAIGDDDGQGEGEGACAFAPVLEPSATTAPTAATNARGARIFIGPSGLVLL
jgi:hypothetical protein